MFKLPCIYIMTNKPRGTLYVGVTSNLVQRTWQHRNHLAQGFTAKYGLIHLAYYELHEDMYEAIKREKTIKNWKRIWKIELIEKANPNWVDLFSQII
jgi:putative endonuclease